MGQFSKSFEELEFSDNYMFCVVMKDIEVCKKFIEILLSIEIDTIEYVETEYPLDVIYNSKGIRMDVFVKNSTTVYDIEMQTSNYSDLIMRARYYLSATDINLTPKNTNYSKLYETYIMFICKKDPFNLKLPIYTEKKVFLEKPDHKINDKSTIIFYNTSEWEKVENQELKCLLKYIYTNKADSPFTKKLDTLVKQIKELQHLRSDYMYFSEIIEEEKEEINHANQQKVGSSDLLFLILLIVERIF